MKRGTPDHPKTQNLARALDLPLFSACGLLELLWHFTAKFAPQGDVGRWSNEEIAVGVRWPGDPDQLVAALVDKRWLDESDEHRLVVHDWHDHADEAVKKGLQRANKPFLTGPSARMCVVEPCVYIVQAEGTGAIKIGHTELPVATRIAALQTGSSERLRLLVAFPAKRREEYALHKRFAACCIGGEWFRPEPELLAFVDEQLKAGGGQRRTDADHGRQRRPARAVAVAVARAIAKPEPEPDLPAADAAPADPPPVALVVREPSWSDEACALWTRFLGTAPGGRIGKALKPFVTEHGWEVVRPLWQEALEDAVTWDDPGKFVPELFGRTFKARLARSRVEVGGLVRVGIPPPTPKEQKHRAALMAGVAGGLKGDGTFGRGE